MKAIIARGAGGPEVLMSVDREAPACGPDEVLVEVSATALNRADMNQRAGTYNLPPGSTDVLGLELAGRVVEVGESVTELAVGDRICALTPGGAHAEVVAVPAAIAMTVPEGMSDVEAAAIPEAFLTAYDNLFNRGGLQRGETVLVHGGSSGIGTTAIQLAREAEARVLVTCGSREKIDACTALGADAGINYREQDFVAEAMALTDGGGVDVVLDHIGGPYLSRNLSALARDGRLVVIGTMGGKVGEVDLADLMTRRVWITGTRLRPRSPEEKARLVSDFRIKFWPAVVERRIRPIIAATFRWEDIADAHRLMESSDHIGKIVLTVGG